MPKPPRVRPAVAGLLILAFACARGRADDPQKPAVVPSDPVFEAVLTDGSAVAGRIRELRLAEGQGEAVLVAEGGQEKAIPLDRLVKLTRRGDASPYPPEGSLLVLPDGDRLRAILSESDGAKVEVLPKALEDRATSAPLDRVLGLILAPPSDPEAMEELIEKVRRDPRDGDVLWLAGEGLVGDRRLGSFLGLDARNLAFESGKMRGEFERSGVVAVGLDPALVGYPKQDRPHLELSFVDGSRLGATACRVEQGQLVAETRLGPKIAVALKELARVHVMGGSVIYLSAREPDAAQFVPYLDRHPGTFGRDRTWDGHHLRLGGRPYDRGIGMLPRTLLAFKLGPEARRFQALVGLDDRAGDQASVVFRVLADKKEVFASPAMTRRDAPAAVDVEVAGAKVLILVVEFGERGDMQDSADWVEARLVR